MQKSVCCMIQGRKKKVRNRTKTKNKFKKCWKINYDTRDIVQKINMEKDKEHKKGGEPKPIASRLVECSKSDDHSHQWWSHSKVASPQEGTTSFQPAAAASTPKPEPVPAPGFEPWPGSGPATVPGTATAVAWPSWSWSETAGTVVAVVGQPSAEGGERMEAYGGLGTGAMSCRPVEAHRP